MPRASDQIGPALRGIAEGNEERYNRLQRIRYEMAEALRFERERANDSSIESNRCKQIQRFLMRKHVYDSREKLGLTEAEVLKLNDDQIEECLDKILSIDAPSAPCTDSSELQK